MSCPSARIWITLSLVAMVVAAGCGQESVHPESLEAKLKSQISAETPAVEVDDRSVDVAEFESFWSNEPSLSREDAVARFVERELIFAPALEAGLADDPEVAVARKRVMVRILLAETVEADVTEVSVEESEVTRVATLASQEIGHPVGLRASHILVSVPPEEKASEQVRKEAYGRARSTIGRIRSELPERPTPYDLLKTRRAFAERVESPLSVDVNAHLQFPISKPTGSLPKGWLNVVPEFRQSALEMARAGRLGELSDPVKSPFGWHLIVVHEVLPGEKPDPDALRAAARAKILERRRTEALSERYDKWLSRADVQQFPSVVESAGELE